jgi:hypothetical protein
MPTGYLQFIRRLLALCIPRPRRRMAPANQAFPPAYRLSPRIRSSRATTRSPKPVHQHNMQQQQRPITPPPSIPFPQLPPSCEPPSPSRPPQQQVWVIFGATGHLGRSICRVALARGDCVTAVGRNIPSEEASMHGWHKRCQGLVCDVRDRATVEEVWRKAHDGWGRVDVVVK